MTLTDFSIVDAPRERSADAPAAGAPFPGREPKVLIVSWYFPPGNTIGAVRVGKFAKFLHDRGRDFRVLTASDWGLPETLPLEVPPQRVIATPWTDINELPPALQALRGWLKRPRVGAPGTRAGGDGATRPRGRGVGHLYRTLTNVPDRQIGWLPHALAHAARRLDGWRPDIIYASAPPFTSLIVADRLAARYRCPWVIEFRDRWVDDPYYEKPPWRMAIETRWERRLVGRADAIVTVSQPWSNGFRVKYPGKAVATILNGFDPDDYARAPGEAPAEDGLSIVYTGAIYPGRRDPTPLFEAMRRLGGTDVRARFYGTAPEHVLPLARRCGVEGLVEVLPSVPYRESIRRQQAADVLLLLQWNDPREQGNVPAKLFEYLAAGRPILGLGLDDGVPATVIRERDAGLFSNEPAAIAAQLARWREEKRLTGRVRPLAEDACRGFSRAEQFDRLLDFLDGRVAAR
ncbi:MAG: glycosyltransferase family 4 protein [Alphaproteobacteria bacterium]|nr:glycosyltransferase family 4 protein [Alphaproteobacteria bacterium]